MSRETGPTVSVITPFFNTDAYLAECIESVLAQSYGDFEYVLVDNHSTDRSSAIAASYAERDPRIRLIRTPQFFTQVQNYNFALEQMSPRATYCKIVQADDWIFPRCLAEMVDLATDHPEVAIVSGYEYSGNRILGCGLPPTQRVIPGRDACRLFLMGSVFMFGSPTTLLYRSDVVRQRRPFYEENRLHEDTEVVFELLADHDFGMVHQVLTFTRVREASIMGASRPFAPDALDLLILVERYGRTFLSAAEYAVCLDHAERFYYGSVVRSWLSRPTREFWKYHRDGLASSGLRLKPARLARHLGGVALEHVLPPVLLRSIRRTYDD
jgi:glycosyltransferase involved in cell wall biosynthesis